MRALIPTWKKIILQRHDRNFDACFDSRQVFSEKKFEQFMEKRQHVFSKITGDILTFEQPFDAKNRKSRLSGMPYMDKTRSSALNVVSIERKDKAMDEAEKKRLNREMLDCIIDVQYRDEERFFELLDSGASINWQHPRIGCTVMHAVGRFNPDFFREVLKRSHEEYNFLIRDNNKWLASGWAFENYPHSRHLYELMRAEEVEYGRLRGIYPGSLRNRTWKEAFPDGYYPHPAPE